MLLASCGGGTDPQPTPGPIIEGNAVQIFLREVHKVGWLGPDDPVSIDSEAAEWEDALRTAEALDLTLYRTVPGTPVTGDTLSGWLIILRGDFHDIPAGAPPDPDAPRRPATAAAFVDRQGRLVYSMRFTDVTPAPQTPTETLPPTYP